MVPKLYSASAPGSLMLMGEHAVLARKFALVCAINKRITITLTPDASASNKIIICDQNLGTLTQNIDDLSIVAPFQFVISAILLFKSKIKTGFTLEIKPEFSSVLGLGSSAAVTVATIAVLGEWLYGRALEEKKIFKIAKVAILKVQGIGSGADIAASVYGGVLGYRTSPLKFIPLSNIPELTVVYCGYKKPTKEVIAVVTAAKKLQPKVYKSIFNAMHICVKQAIRAFKTSDWSSLGTLFSQHQGLQYALGVSDNTLDTLVRQLNEQPQIYGAKISGSGLGDCVIGLGALDTNIFPVDQSQQQQGIIQIAVTIDPKGIVYANH